MNKKLYRSDKNKVLAGVCGGLGEYLVIDPVVIRLIWVVLTFVGGAGILVYIIAALVIPHEGAVSRPAHYTYSGSDNAASQGGEAPGRTNPIDGEPIHASGSDPEMTNTAQRTRRGIIVLGVILVALGLFVLFRGYLPGLDMRTIGAGILILLGLYLIVMRAKD